MNKKDPLKPTRVEEIASQKQLEKYAVQKDSRGVFKELVRQNKEAPIPRIETYNEKLERDIWETSDSKMPKPIHMINNNIIKKKNWSMRPKQWDGHNNLTNDQLQQSVAWSNHLDIAKKPKTLEDRRAAAETRKMILRDYNNPKLKNTLGSDELKLVGKHKSQLNRPVVTPVITPVIKTQVREFIPRQPEKTLEEYMRLNSVVEPGLSDDLVKFRKEVNKNLDYVVGKGEYQENMKDQKVELEDPTQGDNND